METRSFITAFTSARHLLLSWIRSTKSMLSHPTSWRSILILLSHLRLGLVRQKFHMNWPGTIATSRPETNLLSHGTAMSNLPGIWSGLSLFQSLLTDSILTACVSGLQRQVAKSLMINDRGGEESEGSNSGVFGAANQNSSLTLWRLKPLIVVVPHP